MVSDKKTETPVLAVGVLSTVAENKVPGAPRNSRYRPEHNKVSKANLAPRDRCGRFQRHSSLRQYAPALQVFSAATVRKIA